MAPPKKNNAVLIQRSKKTSALAPATLGFASLVTPDDYDPQKPLFKANFHLTPPAIPMLVKKVQELCIEANLDKLLAEMKKHDKPCAKEGKDYILVGAQEWVDGKLKTPKENAPVQLPFVVLTRKAKGKDREGNEITHSMAAWNPHNGLLDLAALKLGIGSVVEPIVYANLFYSKPLGAPIPLIQPQIQLAGVRVLKLVQFGGSAPPSETDEDAIKAILGEAFEVDENLAAFAAGTSAPVAPKDGDATETVKQMF